MSLIRKLVPSRAAQQAEIAAAEPAPAEVVAIEPATATEALKKTKKNRLSLLQIPKTTLTKKKVDTDVLAESDSLNDFFDDKDEQKNDLVFQLLNKFRKIDLMLH